jgi:hypothetical protein
MARLIQICASENDLFALDGEGIVYQFDFSTNDWLKLGRHETPRLRAAGAVGRAGPETARPRAEAEMKSRNVLAIAILLCAALHGAFGIAHAEVPTAGDIAACNQDARESAGGQGASPTSKDEAGADVERRAGERTTQGHGATIAGTQSSDPQIHGMDSEGAKDAAYRAVYRVCMRRKGF